MFVRVFISLCIISRLGRLGTLFFPLPFSFLFSRSVQTQFQKVNFQLANSSTAFELPRRKFILDSVSRMKIYAPEKPSAHQQINAMVIKQNLYRSRPANYFLLQVAKPFVCTCFGWKTNFQIAYSFCFSFFSAFHSWPNELAKIRRKKMIFRLFGADVSVSHSSRVQQFKECACEIEVENDIQSEPKRSIDGKVFERFERFTWQQFCFFFLASLSITAIYRTALKYTRSALHSHVIFAAFLGFISGNKQSTLELIFKSMYSHRLETLIIPFQFRWTYK